MIVGKRLNETRNRTEVIDFTNRMYFPVVNHHYVPLPQTLSQLIIYLV